MDYLSPVIGIYALIEHFFGSLPLGSTHQKVTSSACGVTAASQKSPTSTERTTIGKLRELMSGAVHLYAEWIPSSAMEQSSKLNLKYYSGHIASFLAD